MYKLVSLDLDGTLFNGDDQVSERNLNVIHACHIKGIETVVATGRPPRFTFGYIPEVLNENYCVCYNGAHIYYNTELIYEKNINNTVVKNIIQMVLNMDPTMKIALEAKNVNYCNFDMSKYWPNVDFKDLNELADYDHICKLLIVNCDSLDFDALHKQFNSSCYVIQTDQARLIEIMDRSVSKLEAIKWIANREDILVDEVIAFGDDLNDYEIINGVGMGVAMENGHHEIKGVANEVTLSNDCDGVAVFLEKIIEAL
jgi:hypothetical protein